MNCTMLRVLTKYHFDVMIIRKQKLPKKGIVIKNFGIFTEHVFIEETTQYGHCFKDKNNI